MFVYEKMLQYPVRVKNTNPRLAKVIMTQYGGRYTNRLQWRFQGFNKVAKLSLGST